MLGSDTQQAFRCHEGIDYPFRGQLHSTTVEKGQLNSPRHNFIPRLQLEACQGQYVATAAINYSLRWLMVTHNKAIAGPTVAACLGVNRSRVARGGAVGDGGLLQKLVSVVVLSYSPPLD
jgi:hypothetical protein